MFPQLIRFGSLLLVMIVATTPIQASDPIEASSRIDAIIRLDLKSHQLQPNLPASDSQFVRRVYLDVIGRRRWP